MDALFSSHCRRSAFNAKNYVMPKSSFYVLCIVHSSRHMIALSDFLLKTRTSCSILEEYRGTRRTNTIVLSDPRFRLRKSEKAIWKAHKTNKQDKTKQKPQTKRNETKNACSKLGEEEHRQPPAIACAAAPPCARR